MGTAAMNNLTENLKKVLQQTPKKREEMSKCENTFSLLGFLPLSVTVSKPRKEGIFYFRVILLFVP